jgi:hypothetical protein
MASDSYDDLLTPADVERAMIDLTHHIDKAPKALKGYHEAVRSARAEHRRAYAVAYSQAEGTQLDRKMAADLETQEELDAVDIAEVAYKYASDTFDAYRTKLRALQSVSSLMKASMFGQQGGI